MGRHHPWQPMGKSGCLVLGNDSRLVYGVQKVFYSLPSVAPGRFPSQPSRSFQARLSHTKNLVPHIHSGQPFYHQDFVQGMEKLE